MMARTKNRPEGFFQAPGLIYPNLRDVYLMIGIYVNRP